MGFEPTTPTLAGCALPDGAGFGEIAGRRGALSQCPALLGPWDSGTRPPKALGERAALILATISLGVAVGIEEPALLGLLAEPTGARSGDAELGCHGADGDAAAKQGDRLFEVAGLEVACRPGEPAPVWRGDDARLERPPAFAENGRGSSRYGPRTSRPAAVRSPPAAADR
jgi:hypothetical protein